MNIHRLDPVGVAFWRVFLIETILPDSVGMTVEVLRAIFQEGQDVVGYGQVVVNQVVLGDPFFRPKLLFQIGDLDIDPVEFG